MKAQPPHSRFTFALLLCLLLSGCGDKPTLKQTVQEPPYIPAPPAAGLASEQAKPILDVKAYADLIEMSDRGRHHPGLVDAVSRAIRAGVLQPEGFNETFGPDRAMTYGEFAHWATAYQSALSEAGISLEGLGPEGFSMNHGWAPAPEGPAGGQAPTHDSLKSPMNPQRLRTLPEAFSWNGQALAVNGPLTREALCAVYVSLTHQGDKAQSISPEALEDITPGGSAGGDDLQADEALGQFKDYTAISPWARSAVAVAYQDHIPQRVFRLSPMQLTVDKGLSPAKPVTREEAIVLLDQLYGRFNVRADVSRNLASEAQHSNSSALQGTFSAKPSTARSAGSGQPVGSLQTFSESGPGYRRKASRITVPQ